MQDQEHGSDSACDGDSIPGNVVLICVSMVLACGEHREIAGRKRLDRGPTSDSSSPGLATCPPGRFRGQQRNLRNSTLKFLSRRERGAEAATVVRRAAGICVVGSTKRNADGSGMMVHPMSVRRRGRCRLGGEDITVGAAGEHEVLQSDWELFRWGHVDGIVARWVEESIFGRRAAALAVGHSEDVVVDEGREAGEWSRLVRSFSGAADVEAVQGAGDAADETAAVRWRGREKAGEGNRGRATVRGGDEIEALFVGFSVGAVVPVVVGEFAPGLQSRSILKEVC